MILTERIRLVPEALIQLLRPTQWIKNSFVFAALLFSGRFVDAEACVRAVEAVGLFCLVSSAGYIVNDLKDLGSDRLHPGKSLRPLAAGVIAPSAAVALLALLAAVIAACCVLRPALALPAAAYLVLSIAYSLWLKRMPVVDIFCIAIGFSLRVQAGAAAIDVAVSHWMFITALCLALYLASIKRRQELRLNGSAARGVLERYSVALVERYAEMAAMSALVFYGMFVMSERPGLIATIPLVMFGMFRYWYVVQQQDAGESPTDALLTDRPLQLTVLAWAAVCAGVILWSGRG
jgi:decaprenyl-phosphate phosphoribosyltransferase